MSLMMTAGTGRISARLGELEAGFMWGDGGMLY
jgi:hypothetical protein